MLANKLRELSGVTSGDQIFTSTGTFTVPAGVTTLNIAIVPGTNRSTAIRSGIPLLIATPSFTSQTYNLQIKIPINNNITGNIVANGPYSGGITAWTNGIAVTAGQTISVNVSSGGAVRFMWGPGRSFPSNAT